MIYTIIEDYSFSQSFGKDLKMNSSWGLVYRSVRQAGGECIAIFRPPAVPIPVIQTKHLKYCWDGKQINYVYEFMNKSLIPADF